MKMVDRGVIVSVPFLKEEEEMAPLLRDACTRIQPEDFRFSVMARGTPWDVYKVTVRGEPGFVAFRILEGQLEIDFFERGTDHTEEHVIEVLSRQEN